MPSIVEFHPYPGETLRTNRKGWRERRILVREICGLSLARTTNTLGNDRDALRAYDQKFFELYPYLDRFVRFSELKGKDVLEVGLGYGAVAQKIAESGANLTGLDISPGPVAWLQSRFDTFSLKGRAIQASILDAPFPDSSFDAIVSIGCLHMTGNLKRAFSECARVLRPGGTAVFMVYNALSYYRWFKYPGDTLSYFTRSFVGTDVLDLDENGRRYFDMNEAGKAAPVCALVSGSVLRKMLNPSFSNISVTPQNFARHALLHYVPRNVWLNTTGRIFGLDLYVTATKKPRAIGEMEFL